MNKKGYQSKSKISRKENVSKQKSAGEISIGENVNEPRNTGEELRFNELLLKSFFDSPGHMRGIVEIVNDTDIRHIKDNLVTANYLNSTPAYLEGKLSSELGEPEERIKIWIEHYKISQNSGLPVSWEYADIEGLNKSWLSPTVAYIGNGNEGNPRFTYDIINVTDRKKAEEALQASEELSRQRLFEIEDLYRNAPVGLCILDCDLRFLRINERLAEINGIPAADHIGKTVRELMPTLADSVEPEMRRILETGEPRLNIEIVSETPAQPGFQRTWKEQWLPIREPYGRITGLSIVVEEITMLKRAEMEVIDAQRMTQSLINNSPAIVYAFDREECFLLANTALADLLGSTPEAMIGKRRHDFMPKDDADWHEANDMRVFNEGRHIEFEEYSQLKDRSITWLTTKFPLLDSRGRIYAVAGISNDISDRKQAQVKTETLLAELIERDAQLTELNNTKDKFFNIVAHDLKNPFTSILGSSELLYEKINEMNPENIKKLVLIINDSAKAGYSILLNLLNWSRSQTGMLKISPEKINLKDIVDGNIDTHQLTAYNKSITILNEAEDNLYIISDKNILNTVLRNLLSNAIKYTPRDGKVVVRFKANHETVTILVTDNGVGISQEKIGTLFKLERAYSLPGTENEIGTGLGLKLCKELIEKLGGMISVESEYGKGSTFYFTIPRKNL